MSLISRDRIWPTLIILALGGNVALGVVLIRVAGADPSFAVEPDYYRKAVEWDSVQLQREHNVHLGWRVDASVPEFSTGDPRSITIRLFDESGVPLSGAEVVAEAMPVAFAHEARTVALIESGVAGEYTGEGVINRIGLWEVRVQVDTPEERFTSNLRLDVLTDAPARPVRGRPGDAPEEANPGS